ncbi:MULTISPECIES: tail fiber assembly protein [Enterobacteriaceae]|uniref:Tail fiber assembly protein n=1 Tax=Citrobacter freundii TaxID=546 RepID=A0AAP5XUH6_CITFR|nr:MULTISPECIES: tail fiber assembly protein [Enterobacteriaceae]EEJ2566847.1 tail fiber assembly protein [Salmonella enterica subsp. enterica]EFB1130254.1 tail fiber assembly protein [Escherichia coli]HCL1714468.1 tail fiber assembly protein [Salmonella enterica subsp. enterica serovar Minnesota]ELT3496440.1 tail fiber assembly protein [Citrobacter freundii]MCR1302602.1 tail fiber assembly protein [Enterobacter sp. FL1277]
MQKYVFSAKKNAFFPVELKSSYQKAGEWPNDGIEIEDSVATEFMQEPPEGKYRNVIAGMPAWVDIPPPTQEELSAVAELKKANLRMRADSEINWRQDAVDAGVATEEETAALSEWKRYRVLLMRVDTEKPVWPTTPGEEAS